MKIQNAKQLCGNQLDALWSRKRELSRQLEQPEDGGSFDRVELSRELDAVTKEYEQTRSVMSGILQRESMIRDRESARQQSDAMAEAAQDMAKCMEIARRISSGGTVPPSDEQKLMEFNYEMYMMAKSMAVLRQGEGEEYDSLWEEESGQEEEPSPSETAANSEVDLGALAAGAAAESAGGAESTAETA